jgi:hypothetical protein
VKSMAKSMVRNVMLLVTPAALVAATLGCGKSEPRGDVFGEVRFNGQPVEAGMVSFEFTETVASPRNVPIQKGAYHADGTRALKPGAYRVRITAPDMSKVDPKVAKDPNALVDYVPLLPPSWNVQSKLSVNVGPGKNTFHFRGKKGEEPTVERGTE